MSSIPFAFRTKDINDLPDKWRIPFDTEVKNDNFLMGGQSLLASGKGATEAIKLWAQCLNVGGFNVHFTSAQEIIRRLEGQYIPYDDEAMKENFETAETLIIENLFTGDTSLIPMEEVMHLVWFLKAAINKGVVLVLATESKELDLNMRGPELGELIEQNFEVVHGASSKKKK